MSFAAKKGRLNFDPRTKLILLVIANIVAFTQQSIWVEIVWVVSLLVLIAVCGCEKSACKLAVAFGVCLLLQYYIVPVMPQVLATTFLILATYARKIFPCLIIGTLLLQKTSVREMTAALRKWHIPQGLIIPLSVTIRYFPAIKEEIGYIRDAMKFRDIHGIQKLECYVVQIMMSATSTAEELSAAAVTRGIENPNKKTSIVTMRFGMHDILCVAFGVAFCFAAFIIV